MELNVLLLESVAINSYAVNGLPDTPIVEVLTVILELPTDTSMGALAVPGAELAPSTVSIRVNGGLAL